MHRRFQISQVVVVKLFSFGLGPLKKYVLFEREEGYSKGVRKRTREEGGSLVILKRWLLGKHSK